MKNKHTKYIRWFRDITMDDVPQVGGKNASLGEMYRSLIPQGIQVPNGFAITTAAYQDMLNSAGAWDAMHNLLDNLDKTNIRELAECAQQLRDIVYNAGLSEALRQEILDAYAQLQQEYGADLTVAVRSSATAEDLPTASFAGQHDSYLNIYGDDMLLDTCRHCFASLFTDRAISYRIDKGFDHFKVSLSVGIMKMVRSDLASSGVMFSLDTETGFSDVVFITGAYGLGENIVQGSVDPDEFYVHKPTFQQGHRSVIRRVLGRKQLKMIYNDIGSATTINNVATPEIDRMQFCIHNEDVLTLADYAIKVENHYSQHAGHHMPMDMEWAKDGIDGRLYLIQARPETATSQRPENLLEEYTLKGSSTILATGRSIGTKIASGRARIITDTQHLSEFQAGEVLIADVTSPDWEPVMKIAAAIVTNRGGRTCHAAIIARELGIPAVVGCSNATEVLSNGTDVTVSCAEGEVGKIYQGSVDFNIQTTDLSQLARPATKIMINLGNPELAFKSSFIPCDGVGLARMEFIITQYIKAHPMALLHPERVLDKQQNTQLLALSAQHKTPADFFVERLSEGVGTIAAAFYPKPVIVRMSDFKSNEYASLLGGSYFETDESNPMIGFRGASRYTHPAYAEGFALECMAMKRVRDEMGFSNVKLMIPFCRRVEEGKRVLDAMASHGLRRGDNDLEIYIMCEIPNNVVQIDAFSELFDGFSIGSNDLTQLLLGVDRDSEIVSFDFDERDPGVMQIIRLAVEGARRNKRHSGICGQGPSDYPELAEYLVEIGIDSISLNPDTVLKTTRHILQVEKRLGRKPRDDYSI